jgi:hypothetical protein
VWASGRPWRGNDDRGDLVFVGEVAGDARGPVAGGVQLVGLACSSATAAPKRRALSMPMPAPAPMTSATWPLKS